jgi:glycosyltransferase involved in cell wall biosynthesis
LELLDVAEALHRRGLVFELRFIGFLPPGDSTYARSFLERIRPMEQAGYARFLGPQEESDLVRVFDSVSGVIHFPTEEAFGNVVIEALARNLKFFGSRLGGILDSAGNAPGAELFPSDDWPGLTDALARWLAAGHPRPDDSAAYIRSRFHPDAIARRHLEIYRAVLNRPA